MRRLLLVTALASFFACSREETRTQSTDTASAKASASVTDTDAAVLAVASLSDTLAPLQPAPRVPAQLVIDSAVKADPIAGTHEAATPLCAAGLKDPASGIAFALVRSHQSTSRKPGSRDSTVWGRADYRPSVPARFGMTETQAVRVDCATRRVLGLGPDVTAILR